MGARDERSALIDHGTLVVTGAGRGIGSAIARCAAERGWAVAVNYARDRASADAVVNDIVARGGRAVAIGADIGDPVAAARLVAQAQEALGPIAGLVNNAAITGGIARVADVDATTLARVFAVNVIGAMICAREAVRRMSTANGGSGGAIVNISSRAAVYGSAGEWVHYAASKAAIDAFTIGLAREVASEGIRVNAVVPGFIDTEMHAQSGDPLRLERAAARIPLGRPGTADEVAAAVVWMLSDAARYVTGAMLPVAGGL